MKFREWMRNCIPQKAMGCNYLPIPSCLPKRRVGYLLNAEQLLTHWSRVTHMCVSKLTIIGSDNGLSPDRRQAIIWTNAGTLLSEPLRTNFNKIFIEIHIISFKKIHLKMSRKWRPSRPQCVNACIAMREWFHYDLINTKVLLKTPTQLTCKGEIWVVFVSSKSVIFYLCHL